MKVTDWLAIYAAILSTTVFAWNVLQSRPRLKVLIVFGIDEQTVGAHVSVQNRSPHTVHLSNISLLFRDRQPTWKEWLRHAWRFRRVPRRLGWVSSSLSNYGIPDGCPIALEARKSHHVMIPESTLEEISRRSGSSLLVAVVQDELWNDVHSNVYQHSFPEVEVKST